MRELWVLHTRTHTHATIPPLHTPHSPKSSNDLRAEIFGSRSISILILILIFIYLRYVLISSLSLLIAGGAAGTIEVLCMYPLDVVKTRMQLASGATTGPKTVFGTLRHIAASEGVGNLYRGIISPILAEAPKRACKFASNEQYKKLFAKANGDMTTFRLYLAGASAGATEAFVNTPFEVVKVRMQAKENLAVRIELELGLSQQLRAAS